MSAYDWDLEIARFDLLDGIPGHFRIQLLQVFACLLSPRLSQALFLEKKVYTKIFLANFCLVYNSVIANTRQKEILESFHTDNPWTRVQQ